MIEITLTNKQAKKVLRALRGERDVNCVDDPDIAAIYEEINQRLAAISRATGEAPLASRDDERGE